MLSIVHHLTMRMVARVDKYLNQLVGSSNGLPTFFCAMPRIDTRFVILNEVKNLKVCETVESSINLEILRFTQDDKTVCHSERSEESQGLRDGGM